MACVLLVPAGAAAALWACLPLPAAPRRSFPNKVKLHQVCCMDQLRWKQTLSATKSHRPRSLVSCSSSDSSAEVAALSRPAGVSTAQPQSDTSMARSMDSVPGVLIVISGYWTGPDVDDGCGSVEALLQRIV